MNGSIKTDASAILSSQKGFFANLYKSTNNDLDTNDSITGFLNNFEIPKLTKEQKEKCKCPGYCYS